MITKHTFALTALVGSSLLATLAAGGCDATDPTADIGTPSVREKGLPDGIETTRGALVGRDREELNVIRAGDHLFLSWLDNLDPSTGQPGPVSHAWGMTMDDRTGVGSTPQILASPPQSTDWAEIAYDSVNDHILLAYNITYSASDHDVYAIRMDHNGSPLTSPMTVDASGNDDYGSWTAFDPTTSQFVVMWNRTPHVQNSTVMASYIPASGTPGAVFNFNPPNVSTSLHVGGIVYAKSSTESRFVATTDDISVAYVSTLRPTQTFPATGRNLGNFYRGYLSFMASSNTVGIAGLDSTGGVTFMPFNANNCFPMWNCPITATHLVDKVSGTNMDWDIGAVDGNFIVIADPARDGRLKVVSVSPTGTIVKQRTYTTRSGLFVTGGVVRGPTFNWIFWIDSSFRIIGQKVDDQGTGSGEYVITSN